MKTPLSWISLYSPLESLIRSTPLKTLAHTYSVHTAEIDGIEDHFLDKVVIGKVISCEKHPESKKLSIVVVDIGWKETTILTGAPNIVDALYVPVALVGAVLPGDFVIGERMMAGMMSRGMICSDDELGLASELSDGIMILEQIWNTSMLEKMVGKSFYDLALNFPGIDGKPYQYTLRDVTFEIDNKFITNRPDLFSVHGNAREWHTVFGTPFTPYTPREIPLPWWLPLSIETNACLAYNAWKMEDIVVAKSPWGMALMMERAGLSPKMDIVDITNCLLTELGQPMHAFDADKIHGGITVRQARSWEKILALNNIEYTLSPEDMVIADDHGPIAIAGVIGGMESAVSLETKSVIWESATFDATSVRLTAQRHSIRTDASTRYEKSLDPILASTTLSRVIDYLQFLWKNFTLTSSAAYLDKTRVNDIEIALSYDFISTKIGVQIPKTDIESILNKLGFIIREKTDTSLTLQVPSWRATKDISLKEDIAEEVGRIYGYDKVPLAPLDANFRISQKNHDKVLRDMALTYFSEHGWSEVYNYSFTNASIQWKLGVHDDGLIAIKNAFNEEYTHMRSSLVWRLLENVHNNLRHTERLKFFEIGNIYRQDGKRNHGIDALLREIEKKPFSEKKVLAGVATGIPLEVLRKDMEGFLKKVLGYIPTLSQDDGSVEAYMHPGISGRYHIWDIFIAKFGKIHPGVAESYDIPSETWYFDITFDELIGLNMEKEITFSEISKFQKIDRELNFVVSETVRTGTMAEHLSALHPWIQNISVNSIYRDAEKIWAGKKSVNFAFELVSHENTIRDHDALNIQDMIIARMAELWYTLRS